MKVLLTLLFVAVATALNVCEDKPDGEVPEYACRVYTKCVGGNPVTVECPAGEAFNTDLQTCDDMLNVPHPCGFWRECVGKEDRRYVDVEYTGCAAYYTCHNQYFYGFNFCPDDLVYHESMQLCNWPVNVAPPCGSCATCDG